MTSKQEVIGHGKKRASIFPFTARSSVWKTRITGSDTVKRTQSSADFLGVVSPISEDAIGATARPTTQALQRRNGIEQRQRLGGVVAIRASQFDCQWNATPVTDQMALDAPFSSIGRIRPSLRPPKTARTEQPSTTAWDQSIWPFRESQFSNTK